MNVAAAREAMEVERACAEIARICYTEGRANEVAAVMAEAKRRSQAFNWAGSQSLASVLHDLKFGRRFDEGSS